MKYKSNRIKSQKKVLTAVTAKTIGKAIRTIYRPKRKRKSLDYPKKANKRMIIFDILLIIYNTCRIRINCDFHYLKHILEL